MNINNTKNVISNSDTWAGIYNRLVNNFIRITPHVKDYRNTEQLSVYMEISDPERIQPSYNDKRFMRHHTIYNSPLYSSSNIQGLSKRSLFQCAPAIFQTTTKRGPIRFPPERYALHTIMFTNRKLIWTSYGISEQRAMSYLSYWPMFLHLQNLRIPDTSFLQ